MDGAQAQSAAPKPSGSITPQQVKWHGRLAARLVHTLVTLVAATLRYELRNRSGFFNGEPSTPIILTGWHNQLALSLFVYRKFVQTTHPSRRLAALVSASRDGGLLARILELFNVQPVRGSSSRRGAQALLELTSWAEQGHDLGITPDGPRGPCYRVQEGVVALAQLTGLPIVTLSCSLDWKIRLRSWDRFQVPLPFGRCRVEFGEAIRVPREADAAERERIRLELENRLKSLSAD